MVRTRESAANLKVTAAKAPRKFPTQTSSPTSATSKSRLIGGNPIHPRDTPSWQKPITHFFSTAPKDDDKAVDEKSKQDTGGAGSSLSFSLGDDVAGPSTSQGPSTSSSSVQNK